METLGCAAIDLNDESSFIDEVVQFPILHYSKKEVVRAGQALREPMPYVRERMEEYLQVFRVAYDWRNSHAYPMRRVRFELGGRVRRLDGITAGRIKRMRSIRLKLARTTNTLSQMQDLGGCRAIVKSMIDVAELASFYRVGKSSHKVILDRDYITEPKAGGYRSRHFVLSFQPSKDDELAYSQRRIEVQIRTQLQHVWATAVEAVGLIRGEDLKAGEGDLQWLRLFKLMSCEFADSERCPIMLGVSANRNHRIAEIKAIEKSLSAIESLTKMNGALSVMDSMVSPTSRYYLMQFDIAKETINITGYASPIWGTDKYSALEEDSKTVNSVLVEVDKFENLRAAYPNYYFDVGAFVGNLKRVVRGRELSPIATSPQDSTPLDLTWLSDWGPRGRKRL